MEINFGNPPFHLGYGCSGYVYDSDDNFCFQIEVETSSIEKDKEIFQRIIGILNGESEEKIKENLKIVDGYKIILNDNIPFITIRGWGRLTGQGGGLGLDADTACEIQDNLAKWILNKLTK